MKKFIKFIATALVFALITALAIGCTPTTEESKNISFREFTEKKYQLLKNEKPIEYDLIYDFELNYKMNETYNDSYLTQVPSEDGSSEDFNVKNHINYLYENYISVKRIDDDVFITASLSEKNIHSETVFEGCSILVEDSNVYRQFYQTGKDEIGYYIISEYIIENKTNSSYYYSSGFTYSRFNTREEYKEYIIYILDISDFYEFDDVYLPDNIDGYFTQSKEGVTMNRDVYEGSLSIGSSYEQTGSYIATYTQNGIYTKSKNYSISDYGKSEFFTENTIEIEIDMEYSSSYSPKSVDFSQYEQLHVGFDTSSIIYKEHDVF